ncbi:MAG TPA: 4-(cytidine 5'-diphospho)-2-C-methyl-D-erythritol kinase [Allosphingosinicella sp.]|jgi:4-diphosphocytidyl-2-C-methyl-D-erythritol kinase|uniref:4-(cytidine 5'-diphospho)-2-C-methyl-D-erythritol kinase n=1 Tax=Allosphingosinicella sp. TaxID=2823234 RepID=UPI002F2999F8
MRETAYAKLNLALHVRAREPDGYHRLETLFAFCEDGDELSVAADDELELRIEGPFAADLAAGEDNLVLRAAEALRQVCSITSGAALRLDKRLPVASGIGGGSADAAATLRLLCRFWSLRMSAPELHAVAAGLGADVPACLRSETVRGEGRGDRLSAAENDLAGAPVLLVNPGVAVSTPDVFRNWDGVDRGSLAATSARAAALEGRNDLEAPATAVAPVIADALHFLQSCDGVTVARMSGSGATCFALFEREADREAAADHARRAHPDWWQLASHLR